MITKDKVSEFFVLQTISAKNLKLRCQKRPTGLKRHSKT